MGWFCFWLGPGAKSIFPLGSCRGLWTVINWLSRISKGSDNSDIQKKGTREVQVHYSTVQWWRLSFPISLSPSFPSLLLATLHPSPLPLGPKPASHSHSSSPLAAFGFFFICFFSLFFVIYIGFLTTHKTKAKNMSPFLYKVVFYLFLNSEASWTLSSLSPQSLVALNCGASKFGFASCTSVDPNIKWVLRLLRPLRSLGIGNLVDKSTIRIFPQKLLHKFSFLPKLKTKQESGK